MSDELKKNENKEEVVIEANELVYNKEKEIITAKGNVYIEQKDLQLVTDKVIYDKRKNYLYAIGNLAFKIDKKNVFFGKKAFLNRNQNTGIIIRFKARLSQKGLLASDFIQMLDEKTFLIKRMVFSTCKICKKNFIPDVPLWQICAEEVLIKQKEEKIEYKHSKIELFGKPIFYFPYFITPTPHSSMKSGVLAPNFKNSNVLGFQVSIPYYFSIFPEMDITYMATFSNKSNLFNNINFRFLTKYGLYSINGDFIYEDKMDKIDKGLKKISDKKGFKGFFSSKGDFNFQNNYFLNYKVQRIFDNDKTFIKKYDISNDALLISSVSFRKEKKSHLLTLEALSIQDLRDDNRKKVSYILPWIRIYNKFLLKSPFFSELNFSTNLLNLRKKDGVNYKGGTFQIDVSNNIYLPSGQMLIINPAFRYAYYDVRGLKNNIGIKNMGLGLFINWRWPFIKYIENKYIIIEPIVNFTSNSLISKNFLNEDSQEKIINSSNLFSLNFFIAKNTMDLGSRVNYALRVNYYTGNHIYGAILGQSYKLNPQKKIKVIDTPFAWDKNLRGQKIEIVGKFYAQFNTNIYFVNNISLTPNHLNLIQNELYANIKYRDFQINLNHMFINKKYINKSYNIYNQEIKVVLQYNFYKDWWVESQVKRKLGLLINFPSNGECKKERLTVSKRWKGKNKRWVNSEIGLFYKGDCLKINFGIKRDYFKLKGLNASMTTYLKIEPILN